MNLYKAILKQYGHKVTGGIGSFSQMGFLQGEIAVHALQNMKGAYTFKSVNQAFHSIKGYDTGMLCQPWTFGSYPLHIANNTDYTVTPDNGKMSPQGCTAISSVDPRSRRTTRSPASSGQASSDEVRRQRRCDQAPPRAPRGCW